MTRTDLIRAIAEEENLTYVKTTAVVTAVFEMIKAAVADGNEVSIPKFGKFKSVARAGIIPGTTNKYSTTIPKFKASSSFKEDLK